jgi:DNA polymerase III sliding clamp (beta) subunit (PCNA family)
MAMAGSMVCDAGDLAAALRICGRFRGKAQSAMGDSVQIQEHTGGRAAVCGTDLDDWARVDFPATFPGTFAGDAFGPVVFSGAELTGALRGAKGNVTVQGDGTVVTGAASLRLELRPADEFPPFPVHVAETAGHWYTVEQFRRVLSSVLWSASTDFTRPEQGHALIEWPDDGRAPRWCTTNGHALTYAGGPFTGEAHRGPVTLTYAALLGKILQSLPKGAKGAREHVRIAAGDRWLTVHVDGALGALYSLRVHDLTFPPIHHIAMARDQFDTIAIYSTAALRAAAAGSPGDFGGGSRHNPYPVDLWPRGCQLSGPKGYVARVAPLSPDPAMLAGGSAYLSRNYLAATCAACPSDRIEVLIGQVGRAIMFQATEGDPWSVLIMPLRRVDAGPAGSGNDVVDEERRAAAAVELRPCQS